MGDTGETSREQIRFMKGGAGPADQRRKDLVAQLSAGGRCCSSGCLKMIVSPTFLHLSWQPLQETPGLRLCPGCVQPRTWVVLLDIEFEPVWVICSLLCACLPVGRSGLAAPAPHPGNNSFPKRI